MVSVNKLIYNFVNYLRNLSKIVPETKNNGEIMKIVVLKYRERLSMG